MPNHKRPRLKDVAELAGTSIATASRVFSGTGFVSPETRADVLAAAKQLDYYPNLRARSLRQRASQSIGLIIPTLQNAYYTALADRISQLLANRGYHVLLSSTQDDPATERAMVYTMIGQAVDGLIWAPSDPSQDILTRLVGQQISAVSIVRRVPNDVVDTVVFEDYTGSKAATEHLISLGHRRIGLLVGEVRHSSNHGRWQGYLAAMDEAGLSVDESLVKLDIGPQNGTRAIVAVNDLLHRSNPPTAIFVGSNAIMPTVMKTLRTKEINIPSDISLISFDDVDWFSFSVPPITAVNVGHATLAEAALDLLFERMDNPDEPAREPTLIKIACELVLRGSTAPPSNH